MLFFVGTIHFELRYIYLITKAAVVSVSYTFLTKWIHVVINLFDGVKHFEPKRLTIKVETVNCLSLQPS